MTTSAIYVHAYNDLFSFKKYLDGHRLQVPLYKMHIIVMKINMITPPKIRQFMLYYETEQYPRLKAHCNFKTF